MPKINELKSERGRMFMFKGEFKTGKTIAAGSFPDPTYLFDCDGRVSSLTTYPYTKNKDIEFDTYTDWDKVDRKMEKLIERCDYNTIHMASLTSLARAATNTLFKNRGSSRDKGDKTPMSVGGIPIMGIAEWNGLASGLTKTLTGLRVIHNIWHCNVILEAHVVVGEIQQLGGGTIEFRKLVTGGSKIASEIPGYFDEVYHFYCVKDIESTERSYIAHIRSNDRDLAGTTLPDLPDIINFTNKSFYEIWRTYLPKESTLNENNLDKSDNYLNFKSNT